IISEIATNPLKKTSTPCQGRRKKKADQALSWPAPMGSEGEGGTPKPTACRTIRPHRPVTVQNLLSAPVVPRRRSGALSPQKLGLRHARRKGTRPTNPRKSSSSKHNGPGVRSQRRHAIAAEAPLPGKRALASQVPHPADAYASGRIAGMPRDPVELALLAAADLLPPGTSVLAACSGGPDSVALTSALAACAGALGIRLAVGHLARGPRPQSGAAPAGAAQALWPASGAAAR